MKVRLSGAAVFAFVALVLLFGPAPARASREPMDIIDIYAGLTDGDMMRCCDCHTQQCRGTNEPATWTPRKKPLQTGMELSLPLPTLMTPVTKETVTENIR